jgi:hypothetical protein
MLIDLSETNLAQLLFIKPYQQQKAKASSFGQHKAKGKHKDADA